MGKLTSESEQKIRNAIISQVEGLVDAHLDAILDAYRRALIHHSEEGNDKPLKFPVGLRAVLCHDRDWSIEVSIGYGVRVKQSSEITIREDDMVDLMGNAN